MNESYASPGYGGRGFAERGYGERGFDRGGYDRGDYDGGGGDRAGDKSTIAGGVILGVLATLSGILVILGLFYATGTTERHKAAMAAGDCEPNLMSTNVGCTTVQMMVSRYNGITNPAIAQLNADVAAYTAAENHSLGTAEGAVRAELATAIELARNLGQMPFAFFAEPQAKVTILAIQARIRLMNEQAASTSLTQLRSFNSRMSAVGTTIQTDLKLLRTDVEHHPTASQEPSGND
jgi:hypothetical protein